MVSPVVPCATQCPLWLRFGFFSAIGVSAVAFIQTASEISPADPSLPQLPAAILPLPLPIARCDRHLPDCVQPLHQHATTLPLPRHPQPANVRSEILSSPVAEA